MSRASTPSHQAQSRGRDADTPSAMPARGWTDVFWRVLKDFSENRIMALAASVTYYGLLAIFPAIAAMVALYGLFSDPASVEKQMEGLSTILPGGAIQIVGDQVKSLASSSGKTTGIAFVGGLLIALWSASSGMKSLFDALNITYGEREKRGFFKLSAVALAFTVGGIVVVVIALAGTVAVPVVLNALHLEGALAWVISVLRWILLVVVIGIALAIIYRYGPSRREPRWRWVSWGSAFGTIGWLIISALFSWYAANFGKFNATYGSLGAVIGLMTWLWLSATVILLGAQINAELEHQTARDTTEGPDKAMGRRGAKAADTVGPPQS